MGTYGDVDQRDAGPVVGVGLVGVDERVLAPVAHHEPGAHQHERHQEDEEGRPAVDLEQRQERGVVGQLPEGRLERERGAVFPEEVQRQVAPDEEVEASDVVQEVPDVVPLVAEGGGQVVGPVAFDVVVLHVVVEVCVPRMAHQRVGDVRERDIEQVDQRILLAQHTTAVDVLMHHECVRAHVVELHGGVDDSMQIREVVVEPNCARDGGGEVEDEVGDHHHVASCSLVKV